MYICVCMYIYARLHVHIYLYKYTMESFGHLTPSCVYVFVLNVSLCVCLCVCVTFSISVYVCLCGCVCVFVWCRNGSICGMSVVWLVNVTGLIQCGMCDKIFSINMLRGYREWVLFISVLAIDWFWKLGWLNYKWALFTKSAHLSIWNLDWGLFVADLKVQ